VLPVAFHSPQHRKACARAHHDHTGRSR
jgi:hypothetical protein